MIRTSSTVAGYEVETIGDVVALGRKATAALRRLDRTGGSTRATVRAQERHAAVLREVLDKLDTLGRRDLSGAITDEDKLAIRLDVAAAQGQDRPELQRRLKAARQLLRSAGKVAHSRAWCSALNYAAGHTVVFVPSRDDAPSITCLSCLESRVAW